MTDNGPCYTSRVFARAFAKACRELGLKHLRTRPRWSSSNPSVNQADRWPEDANIRQDPVQHRGRLKPIMH